MKLTPGMLEREMEPTLHGGGSDEEAVIEAKLPGDTTIGEAVASFGGNGEPDVASPEDIAAYQAASLKPRKPRKPKAAAPDTSWTAELSTAAGSDDMLRAAGVNPEASDLEVQGEVELAGAAAKKLRGKRYEPKLEAPEKPVAESVSLPIESDAAPAPKPARKRAAKQVWPPEDDAAERLAEHRLRQEGFEEVTVATEAPARARKIRPKIAKAAAAAEAAAAPEATPEPSPHLDADGLELAFADAKSWEDLDVAAARGAALIGEAAEYDAAALREVLENVRRGAAPAETVTAAFGARRAAYRLLAEDERQAKLQEVRRSLRAPKAKREIAPTPARAEEPAMVRPMDAKPKGLLGRARALFERFFYY